MNTSRRGFSLVEVLIALAISAILFTSAFMVVGQAIRLRNAMANSATPYVIGPAILDLIAADVANAHFYDLKDNDAFYGANAELNGRDADALSFIATSKSFAPEEYAREDRRDARINEIAYVMRRGPGGTPFLELWRREDFFVDEKPHTDGDYVLVYDKVHSLSIQYISRDPTTESGVSGSKPKSESEMLQDGWNSVKEGGMPRALQVTLQLYAQDSLDSVEQSIASGKDTIYTFQRFIPLPQIWSSLAAERSVRDWDGRHREPAPPARGGANAAASQRAAGGVGGRPPGGRPRGGQRPPPGPGHNEILNIFRGRGGGSGGQPPPGLTTIFGAIPR